MPDKVITGTATVGGVDHVFSLTVAGAVAGDTTSPALSSPNGVPTGPHSADLYVVTDDNAGQLYVYLSPNSVVPGATENERKQNLKDGVGATMLALRDVTASGTQIVTIAAGLLASTSYYAHFLHRDTSQNDSAIVTSPVFATSAAPVSGGVPQVSPSANWSGAPTSGFSVEPVATPEGRPVTDPSRPVLRLFFADREPFSSTHRVYIAAGARDTDGTMLNTMGIDRIEANYEGGLATLTTPALHAYTDQNGVQRSVYGYAIDLVYNGDGAAWLYLTAYARDPAMFPRVAGPFYYYPNSGPLPVLEIAANGIPATGALYNTFAAACAYAEQSGWGSYILNVTETAEYDPDMGSVTHSNGGRCIIQGSVPFTVGQGGRAGALVYDTLGVIRSSFRPNATWWKSTPAHIEFRGQNCTVDYRFMAGADATVGSVNFNACVITHTGGRAEYWAGGSRLSSTGLTNTEYYVRDCAISYVNEAGRQGHAVVNCTLIEGTGSLFSGCRVVYGNSVNVWGKDIHYQARNAAKIAYTGGAGLPTIDSVDTSGGRNIVFKVAAATVGTYFLSSDPEDFVSGSNFLFSHLAAYVNTLPGWSMTVDDNSVRATSLDKATNNRNRVFTNFQISTNGSAPTQLYSFLDMHADWASQGKQDENVFIMNNVSRNLRGMIGRWFGNPSGAKDYLVLNCIWHQPTMVNPPNQQLFTALSHVVFLHCTWTHQVTNIGTGGSLDDKCAYSGSVLPALNNYNNRPVNGSGNHNHVFNSTNTWGGVGFSGGGDASSCFVDLVGGNFRPNPNGPLAQGGSLKPRLLQFDINGNERATSDAAGAVRLAL